MVRSQLDAKIKKNSILSLSYAFLKSEQKSLYAAVCALEHITWSHALLLGVESLRNSEDVVVHKHASCFKAVLKCHLTLKKCVPELKVKLN